eukprot:Tbor_TRINITY_DN5248_c1_g1::TRINITY_DN5248_c1_g1_i1::g.16587::m.16587
MQPKTDYSCDDGQELQKCADSVDSRNLNTNKNTNNHQQPSENCVIYPPIEIEGQHQAHEYEGDYAPNIAQDLDTVPQIDIDNEPVNTSSVIENGKNPCWLSRQLKQAHFMDIIPHGGAVSSGLNLASATL